MKRKSKDKDTDTSGPQQTDKSTQVKVTNLLGDTETVFIYPDGTHVFKDGTYPHEEHFRLSLTPEGVLHLEILSPFSNVPREIRRWAAAQEIKNMTLAEVHALLDTSTEVQP